MTNTFKPVFTITNQITAGLAQIERAQGFLEAATLSAAWVREMGRRALILEAHHTTHIEGTRLTLEQAEQLLDGQHLPDADPDDVQELLNYKKAFDFVSEYLEKGGPITELLHLANIGKSRITSSTLLPVKQSIRHHLRMKCRS